MSRLNLYTLALAVMLMPMPAETAARSGLKDIIMQAEIPKAGDFIGFGFGSLWMMSSGSLIRVNPVDNSFMEIGIKGSFGRYRGIGVGEGAVWIPDVDTDIVYKVDPDKNEVVGQIPVQMAGSEGSIGIGEGAIWVVSEADGTLIRFNTSSGTQDATIVLPSGGAGVVVDYGSVWVTSDRANELYRIDPKTNTIVSVLALRRQPRFIASGEKSIWALNQGDGSVQRIDGETGRLVATIEAGFAGSGGDITTGGGYVWVTTIQGRVGKDRSRRPTGWSVSSAANGIWGTPFVTARGRFGYPDSRYSGSSLQAKASIWHSRVEDKLCYLDGTLGMLYERLLVPANFCPRRRTREQVMGYPTFTKGRRLGPTSALTYHRSSSEALTRSQCDAAPGDVVVGALGPAVMAARRASKT